MEIHPFTFAEAEEIAEDFEDLKDSEFMMSTSSFIVDDVLISPFDKADKDAFFATYVFSKQNGIAGGMYKGPECDVIIAVTDLFDEGVVSYVEIRQYVSEKGVNYNFPS
jgi:hypothetical protein